MKLSAQTRWLALSALLALPFLAVQASARQPVPPPLTSYTKGRVGIGIPAGWKETAIPGATDVLGFWSVDGKNILDTTAVIMVGKAKEADLKLNLNQVTVTQDIETTVGGKPARRVVMQDKANQGGAGLPGRRARGIGLVLKTPEPDGKYLVFVFLCAADQWDKLSPQFEASIASITIDGKGNVPAAGGRGTVNVLYLDRGQEKPLAGATVVIGRRLYLLPSDSAGSVDVVRGDAVFTTGTTDTSGSFVTTDLPPGEYTVTIWKTGHVPVQNRKLTIPGGVREFLAPDAGVGAANRHRTLDTSKVFSMKPPSPKQTAVWGRITLGTRTAATPNAEPAPGEGVTILVGENLSLASTGLTTITDVVNGDAIYAEVQTQADGTFAIPVSPGTYSLIIWKQGYVPEERILVNVWPGQTFYTLLKDDAPGGINRHVNLDTTGKNIPRKKIDPRPGIRGTVRLTDRGVRTPGEGVTILVGPDLRLDHPQVPNPTDKVIGTALTAQTKTDRDGQYFVAVPPGSYRVVVWKEGCIPQEFDAVTVPPGVHNATLSVDNQPGNTGRHRSLDLSGIKKTVGAAINPAMVPLLPFLLAAPPEMTSRTVGNVTLGVPAEWRKDPDTPADEGAWLVGKAEKPDVYFGVLRDTAFDRLASLVAPTGAAVTVDGRKATSYTGPLKSEPGMYARLVVLAETESDGRRVAFLAKAPAAAWAEHEPTFDAILKSIKIARAKSPGPPPPPPEDLKELATVARIPGFTAAYSYAAYEDRVVLTDAGGKTAIIGVAGSGKPAGPSFRDYLKTEKRVAAVLGEAVSLEMTSLGGALAVQVFRGGALVQEKASGKLWWNAHAERPRDLRPADEITRYPRVLFNNAWYAVMAYPDRVQIEDFAGKQSMAVKVGTPGQPIPEAFRKVLDADKLQPNIGRAVSGPEPLFDTAARVQVYEGGVLMVLPGTNLYWWARHTKRGTPGGVPTGPVALPKDPNAVVVQLDYVGGYTPPRKTDDPYLRIRADGRVTLIDPFGKQKPVEAKLTPENVLAFVKFAVEEKGFFAIDSATMEREIKAEAKRLKLPTVLDLPTTVITVRTAEGTHEVRCYAPDFYAEQLPKLKSVQDFQAVHQRLTAYMEKLRGP